MFLNSKASTCQCSTKKDSVERGLGRAQNRNTPRARSKHTPSLKKSTKVDFSTDKRSDLPRSLKEQNYKQNQV